jgi:heptosyltransferase III
VSGRTLVIHTGGIGDIICALPALEQVARRSSIEIAGITERAALAEAANIATRIHSLEATGFSSIFSTPSESFKAFLERFDQALIWLEDGDGHITNTLCSLGIDDVRCFPGVPTAEWKAHAVEYYARCVGVSVPLPFSLPVPPSDTDLDVLLHPGSGGAQKNWDMAHFQAIEGTLKKEGRTVSWCLGPAEESIVRPQNVLPEMSLLELASTLSCARLFIGNDSGISHLASVVGCPTVSIFGPTDAAIWKPVGPRCVVPPGDPWPTAEAVLNAAALV